MQEVKSQPSTLCVAVDDFELGVEVWYIDMCIVCPSQSQKRTPSVLSYPCLSLNLELGSQPVGLSLSLTDYQLWIELYLTDEEPGDEKEQRHM
ncbi:hypothetical protein STEG23_027091, partial [Scotinomys teguina]